MAGGIQSDKAARIVRAVLGTPVTEQKGAGIPRIRKLDPYRVMNPDDQVPDDTGVNPHWGRGNS
jgi:hypothetical protein